jgi:hypothetical protein
MLSSISTGVYEFTVRSLTNPVDVKTKRLTITAEVAIL